MAQIKVDRIAFAVCVLIFIACPAAALAHSTAIKSVNIRPGERRRAGGRERATLRLKLIAAIYFHNANISNSRFTRVESVALVPPTGGQSAGASTLKELQPRGEALNFGSLTHICIENRGPSRSLAYLFMRCDTLTFGRHLARNKSPVTI